MVIDRDQLIRFVGNNNNNNNTTTINSRVKANLAPSAPSPVAAAVGVGELK
jgi:hypothetical protein